MTTERNASRASELIKEGTGYVRDGRMTDAYRTFREVAAIDPNNEYAWIWISQTSPDRAERQAAINRALQINPNSQYAQQALSRMNQEEAPATAQYPPRGGMIGGGEAPAQSGGRFAMTPNTNDADDLRAAMGANAGGKKKGRNKQSDPRTTEPSRQTQQMTAQRQPRRSNPFRLVLLALIAFLILGALFAYVLLNQQNTAVPIVSEQPTPAITETTAPTTSATGTPDAAATTVTSANPSPAGTTGGTTAATTTNPAPATSPTANTGGVALVPTPTFVSGAASVPAGSAAPAGTTTTASTSAIATTAAATTPGTTTSAATSPATTTGSATTSPAATTAVAATTPAATTPVGTGSNSTTTDQLNQAQQLVSTGDYKGAITILNDLVKNEPKNVSANFRLGAAYLAAPTDQLGGADRYTEALKSFKRVTDFAPTWAGGHARLGETYAAKGDLPNAIAAFTRSLELDPNGPERWLALAVLYDKNNQPAEAAYARSRAQNLGATPPPTTAAPVPTPTVKP